MCRNDRPEMTGIQQSKRLGNNTTDNSDANNSDNDGSNSRLGQVDSSVVLSTTTPTTTSAASTTSAADNNNDYTTIINNNNKYYARNSSSIRRNNRKNNNTTRIRNSYSKFYGCFIIGLTILNVYHAIITSHSIESSSSPIMTSLLGWTVSSKQSLDDDSITNNDYDNNNNPNQYQPNQQPQQTKHPKVIMGIFTSDLSMDEVRYRNVYRDLLKTFYPKVCSLYDYTNNNTNQLQDSCELMYTFVLGGATDTVTEMVNDSQYPNRPIILSSNSTNSKNGATDFHDPDMTFLNIK